MHYNFDQPYKVVSPTYFQAKKQQKCHVWDLIPVVIRKQATETKQLINGRITERSRTDRTRQNKSWRTYLSTSIK